MLKDVVVKSQTCQVMVHKNNQITIQMVKGRRCSSCAWITHGDYQRMRKEVRFVTGDYLSATSQ